MQRGPDGVGGLRVVVQIRVVTQAHNIAIDNVPEVFHWVRSTDLAEFRNMVEKETVLEIQDTQSTVIL